MNGFRRPVPALLHSAMRPRPAGFTLIELMIVVAVVGVLAVVAFPSFNYLIATNSAKAAATELYVSLTLARSEAVKRNASVKLVPVVAGDWQKGWQVQDASNVVLDDHGAAKGVTITDGPTDVTYLSSGRISGSAPSFLVKSTGGTVVVRCVSVSSSGRPLVAKAACA